MRGEGEEEVEQLKGCVVKGHERARSKKKNHAGAAEEVSR